MDPNLTVPSGIPPVLSNANRLESVRAAMQPIPDDSKHALGSLKARQQRIRHIHRALHVGAIPEPSLDDLNDEQLDAMQLALDGYGLYITGAAGTGKTHLFTRICEALICKPNLAFLGRVQQSAHVHR
ncbi:hypothetical protein OG21DRAFT_627625 [Imleria badia]|nr:hypothetical protein OG21DRAFT_627625 [Imleria badia]